MYCRVLGKLGPPRGNDALVHEHWRNRGDRARIWFLGSRSFVRVIRPANLLCLHPRSGIDDRQRLYLRLYRWNPDLVDQSGGGWASRLLAGAAVWASLRGEMGRCAGFESLGSKRSGSRSCLLCRLSRHAIFSKRRDVLRGRNREHVCPQVFDCKYPGQGNRKFLHRPSRRIWRKQPIPDLDRHRCFHRPWHHRFGCQ